VCLRMCALLVHEVYLGIFSEHILIEHILSKIEATPCLCTMCNLSYSWLGTLPHKKKNFQSQFPSGLCVAHVLNITPLYTVFWTGSAHWQKKIWNLSALIQGSCIVKMTHCKVTDFWGIKTVTFEGFFSRKKYETSVPQYLYYTSSRDPV
jgi:hypothetical protein